MKTAPHKRSSPAAPASPGELAELRARLGEAEGALRAIRSGEVDAVVVTKTQGPQVFTLEGAGHAYRILIESMNEGALTLTADKMILYANQCFARMAGVPLEQVTGGSFRRFLSDDDGATLKRLLNRGDKSGSKIQMLLNPAGRSPMPVQISIRPLARNGFDRPTFGMVVTDMTESRRTEELLRALTRRVVQVQEAERGRVALELHDNITQLLCAIVARWAALAGTLPAHGKELRGEVMKLSGMLGQTVEEVQRIARNLRPSILDELGLVPALRATCAEFAHRTGVAVKLACAQLTARLPADTELTLYRILQEALKNVEKHACARRVTVRLTQPGAFVQLVIKDDGIGFDPDHHPARRNGKGGLGLFSMRERARCAGGTLKLKSVRHAGTVIEGRIPLPPGAAAANETDL